MYDDLWLFNKDTLLSEILKARTMFYTNNMRIIYDNIVYLKR
jgi:hypothetical protein